MCFHEAKGEKKKKKNVSLPSSEPIFNKLEIFALYNTNPKLLR